jgi:prevent-host-death family protein
MTMKQISLAEAQNDLSRILQMAEDEEIVVTDQGRPVGVLIGIESDDDWSDYLLESDPRFLNRVAKARESYLRGDYVRLEDLDDQLSQGSTTDT